MSMELSLRCRCWSALQVVAIIVCYGGKVLCEKAQGCVGSRLSLICPQMKVIEVTAVVLGDSGCLGTSCCIKDNDCTGYASADHAIDVYNRCDGQNNCTVVAIKESIMCGYTSWSNSDFERITYNCIDDPRTTVSKEDLFVKYTTHSSGAQPTADTSSHISTPDDKEDTEQYNASDTSGIVIICGVCLIVIVAVVASVSVIIVRRKKRRHTKVSDAIKKSDLETGIKEAIYVNDVAGISLNENAGSSVPIYINSGARNIEPPTSDYCQLEGVARGRIQCDSQYVQLDHGRNYEPLIVYEQLK